MLSLRSFNGPKLVRTSLKTTSSCSRIVRLFSLISRHADFLNLIKDHGSGDILLQNTSKPEIVVLKLANPSRKNAISGRMMFQLAAIVDSIVDMDDPSRTTAAPISTPDLSKVINPVCQRPSGLIIVGAGDSFCAGADFGLAKEVLVTPELGRAMSLFMTDALNSLRNSSLISVCLLNGPAVGGGAEFCTVGDFRLIAPQAFVRFIHAKMGVSPGWGGIGRLHSILGRTQSLRLLGTSRVISPDEAVDIGFAEAIVPGAASLPVESSNSSITAVDTETALIDSALEFLLPYTAEQSFPDAVRCIKRAVVAADSSFGPTAAEARTVELDMFARRWQSTDNQKALESK